MTGRVRGRHFTAEIPRILFIFPVRMELLLVFCPFTFDIRRRRLRRSVLGRGSPRAAAIHCRRRRFYYSRCGAASGGTGLQNFTAHSLPPYKHTHTHTPTTAPPHRRPTHPPTEAQLRGRPVERSWPGAPRRDVQCQRQDRRPRTFFPTPLVNRQSTTVRVSRRPSVSQSVNASQQPAANRLSTAPRYEHR